MSGSARWRRASRAGSRCLYVLASIVHVRASGRRLTILHELLLEAEHEANECGARFGRDFAGVGRRLELARPPNDLAPGYLGVVPTLHESQLPELVTGVKGRRPRECGSR